MRMRGAVYLRSEMRMLMSQLRAFAVASSKQDRLAGHAGRKNAAMLARRFGRTCV